AILHVCYLLVWYRFSTATIISLLSTFHFTSVHVDYKLVGHTTIRFIFSLFASYKLMIDSLIMYTLVRRSYHSIKDCKVRIHFTVQVCLLFKGVAHNSCKNNHTNLWSGL